MKKLLKAIFIFLIFGLNNSIAQDGVYKSKKIILSFSNIDKNSSINSLDLYQNGLYSNNEGYYFRSKFDTISKSYILDYSYVGIGGGNDNRLSCPVLFLKVNFKLIDKKEYFQLIPISLDICAKSQIREIKVLNINVNEIVERTDKMILINENGKYEIVQKQEIKFEKLYKLE